MKRLLIIIAIALAGYGAFCQDETVNIPDAEFKKYLLENKAINTNGDGEITVAEAAAFTGEINVQPKGFVVPIPGLGKGIVIPDRGTIESLKGIEAFVNITSLSCSKNKLTALDVSQNTALTKLYCFSNQLTALDVSQNTALTKLSCSSNQLTALDVSQNTALTFLGCSYNLLNKLDVSQNTALTKLSCFSNQLTSLDVSENTELTNLFCSSNQLTALDVSENTALTNLFCSDNPLNALDVSENTALTWLHCLNNKLNTLDVSQNTALTILYCLNNKLKALNLKNGNNANLTTLFIGKNTALSCVQVDDVAAFKTKWSERFSSDKINMNIISEDCFVKNVGVANEGLVTAIAEDFAGEQLMIYPNPVSDIVIIKATDRIVESVTIQDLTGTMVKSLEKNTHSVNVSSLSSGTYLVKVKTATGIIFSKFLKINP